MAAGAPKGNKNAAKGRRATMALERALDIRDKKAEMPKGEGYSVLVEIWDKQIVAALNGDKGALTMIADRLDGSPRQTVDVGGQEDNPMKWTVEFVNATPKSK